jgi:hypothetical protein
MWLLSITYISFRLNRNDQSDHLNREQVEQVEHVILCMNTLHYIHMSE